MPRMHLFSGCRAEAVERDLLVAYLVIDIHAYDESDENPIYKSPSNIF